MTKKLTQILFAEDVEEDFVSKTEIRFSAFRLASLLQMTLYISEFNTESG